MVILAVSLPTRFSTKQVYSPEYAVVIWSKHRSSPLKRMQTSETDTPSVPRSQLIPSAAGLPSIWLHDMHTVRPALTSNGDCWPTCMSSVWMLPNCCITSCVDSTIIGGTAIRQEAKSDNDNNYLNLYKTSG